MKVFETQELLLFTWAWKIPCCKFLILIVTYKLRWILKRYCTFNQNETKRLIKAQYLKEMKNMKNMKNIKIKNSQKLHPRTLE